MLNPLASIPLPAGKSTSPKQKAKLLELLQPLTLSNAWKSTTELSQSFKNLSAAGTRIVLVAWRPSELQGYISKYFQSNMVALSQPYSHLSLMVVNDGELLYTESCIDGLELLQLDTIDKFIEVYGEQCDFYLFNSVMLEGEQIVENINYVSEQGYKPTTYGTLYRALIGFDRDDSLACTSHVLDCLGLQSERYYTVLESILIVAHYYYLLDIYGN